MEYKTKRILKKGDSTVELIQPSNGGVVCDCYDGPCSCGAWHSMDFNPKKEYTDHRIKIIEFFAKIELLKEIGYEPVNFEWRNLNDL